jgi:hypothetical protein
MFIPFLQIVRHTFDFRLFTRSSVTYSKEAQTARGAENNHVLRYVAYCDDGSDCSERKCRPEVGQGLSIYTCW